ncbi:FimV/HubP family polar landmark protein [Dyella sp. SG609]|uniref:FimV/HubP family polar landmark protein n=1 Tax=Dyella sp. SG609 TaxID=2587018 RepID=UPI001445502E|nr:FimV/HubP family polar landmark protein [Dyella sp. SG609]NKJ22192.1 pilus assembly protein FimV [Dyella sp. SG609]
MNRSLRLSVLLALALGSTQAAALELGQIQVKSALGQPLLAEIPLNPEHPSELQNLSAKLASGDEFAKAGISGAPNIPLQFAVIDGGNGRKVIRITSAAPVNDPYLDLLVEVSSATGKSVREFAILLDPPSSPGAAPATRAPAVASSSSKPARHAAPAPAADEQQAAAKPAPAKPAPAAAPALKNGEYGPVERGQTLSSIAKDTAPQGVDINQMLLALKQANPDAFYRDNINALKTGAVLRVPSAQDAQAMAVAAAAAEVRRQNGDWSSGAARTATSVADAGTRPAASTAPTAGKGEPSDRLSLVPAKDGAQGAAGGSAKGDGKDAKAAAGLREDLLRSKEALATLEQQGNELKSRLKDLEDINQKNTKLLALKDNEIADLQRKLAEARKGAPAAAAEAKPAEAKPAVAEAPKPAAEAPKSAPAASAPKPADTLAVTPAGTSSAPASTGSAAATAPVASTPAKPENKPAPKPAPVAPPAPAEEEPWYMQTWALATGAGAVVLLLLGALLGRRKKSGDAPAPRSASSLADRFGAEPTIGGSDPDQDELLDQLAEHPDDVGLHLELVSLYYSRRDVEHFEAAAEAMHAHISSPDQPEWLDVVSMGEDLVPGHPLFSGGNPPPLPPQNEDEHEALHQFDLDRYAETQHDDIPPIPAAPLPPKNPKVSEYHFDFDLTPRPLANAAPVAAEPEPVAAPEREPVSTWQFADLEDEIPAAPAHSPVEDDFAHAGDAHEGGFNDDPVDTKLDLARAYLDMGDPDGARAMLEEVLHEGTQMQKDVAQKLLDGIR